MHSIMTITTIVIFYYYGYMSKMPTFITFAVKIIWRNLKFFWNNSFNYFCFQTNFKLFLPCSQREEFELFPIMVFIGIMFLLDKLRFY